MACATNGMATLCYLLHFVVSVGLSHLFVCTEPKPLTQAGAAETMRLRKQKDAGMREKRDRILGKGAPANTQQHPPSLGAGEGVAGGRPGDDGVGLSSGVMTTPLPEPTSFIRGGGGGHNGGEDNSPSCMTGDSSSYQGEDESSPGMGSAGDGSPLRPGNATVGEGGAEMAVRTRHAR